MRPLPLPLLRWSARRLVVVALVAVVVASAGATAACGPTSPASPAPPAPACATGLSPSCAATYAPPTYATIYAKILHPTCATGQGTCHTSDAAEGGLVFEDESTSYALLLGTADGKKRVIAGDPSCSLITERLTSTVESFHMPPGPNSISAGDLCTIVQWISEGAAR